MIGSEEIDRLVDGLMPPPAAAALRDQADRDHTTLREIVKDALYAHSAKSIIERARLDGTLLLPALQRLQGEMRRHLP